MKMEVMSSRCGTTRGVVAGSKSVEVFDSKNNLIRKFASVAELQKKSKKYLGMELDSNNIRVYCKNKKLYKGKYYFRMEEIFIF